VVLREGPLEFLACFAGKEHESIVRLEASATHIYMALGLIGLTPGHPPRWDDQHGTIIPPAGDLVDLSFEWEREGRRETAEAHAWLEEIEYARIPLARPWLFTGSVRLPDDTLASDRSGVGVTLVDFGDSLLALSRPHSSQTGELWVVARTEAIPAVGTPVQLVLRPAKPRSHRVEIDFRGAVFVDGRYASPTDLADLLRLARQLDPQYVQGIALRGTLRTDVRRLQEELRAFGVTLDMVRFDAATSRPTTALP
jgi:hypothetical protein